MRLENIVTLSNIKFRLRFLAMERSLRAVGCDLPLLVIPYDGTRFDLPKNSEWWEMTSITNWLTHAKAHPAMRKYQCLTIPNFQFVDSDICFLRNPAEVLEPLSGFITSCGHWHNPGHTYSPDSLAILKTQSTTWQKSIFNSGQWACDKALFSVQELKDRAEQPGFRPTCLSLKFADQAGINMLVHSTNTSITNLTLPPHNMQSTWAGDYDTGGYKSYWKTEQETPYLIHWAGVNMRVHRPIHEIFHQFLSQEEFAEWKTQLKSEWEARHTIARQTRRFAQTARRATRMFFQEFTK